MYMLLHCKQAKPALCCEQNRQSSALNRHAGPIQMRALSAHVGALEGSGVLGVLECDRDCDCDLCLLLAFNLIVFV
jgi:hypothetical protein